MLHLEGEKLLKQPYGEVWRKLVDLQFLVRCIPDVAEVKSIEDPTANVVLRPGFSFIRGELQLSLTRQDAAEPERAAFLARTKGIGSTADVLAAMTLSNQDGGTLMRWTADVQQLGGLLKAVPRGLIQAAASKVITDLLAGIERELASQPEPGA